jgi:SAM-dependent methyltransferase
MTHSRENPSQLEKGGIVAVIRAVATTVDRWPKRTSSMTGSRPGLDPSRAARPLFVFIRSRRKRNPTPGPGTRNPGREPGTRSHYGRNSFTVLSARRTCGISTCIATAQRLVKHASTHDSLRQAEYFSSVAYRSPDHPVVRAYAEPKLDFIRRYVPLSGCILDLGCGNGIFSQRLAREGAFVTGLDLSAHLLAQNPHRILTRGDASMLPFGDGSFDVVFEANLLHHVPDRDRVVREMCRVSRKHVILLEPNRYNPLMLAFSAVVAAERGGLKSSAKRLRQELAGAGMRVLACRTTGMISQNNTPQALIPLLRRFDRQIWWGEYIVVVAEKM